MPSPFLTARWEHLTLISWHVPADLLTPYLPRGLELDLFENRPAVSLVAFAFRKCKVKGFSIPFHTNFPEVNLRFYVRDPATGRRGVSFIREFVPQPITCWVARAIYNEPYEPRHIAIRTDADETRVAAEYIIDPESPRPHRLTIDADPTPSTPDHHTVEHWFKEHEWGYGRTRRGTTLAYRVVHPLWRTWPVRTWTLDARLAQLYGSEWSILDHAKPINITFAEGSHVEVWPAS